MSENTRIMASVPITSWQIDGGNNGNSEKLIFLGSKISADGDFSHEINMLDPWKKNYDKPRQHKKQRHYFADKGPSGQSYGLFSSHVTTEWM